MTGAVDSGRFSALVGPLVRDRRSRRLSSFGGVTVLLAGLLIPGLIAGPVSAETSPARAPLTVTKACLPVDDTGRFNLRVDGRIVLANAACGASVVVSVSVGRHTVSETAGTNTKLSSYSALIGGACTTAGSVTLVANIPASCAITNTRLPTLTITKICVPTTDGGEFNIRVDGRTVLANAHCGRSTSVPVTPGVVHTVSETAGEETSLARYSALIGGGCAADGTITLAVGQLATCTITNTRIPPAMTQLTVTKVCVPDDGQNGLFNLRVDGLTVLANAACGGSTQVTLPVGRHTVSESAGTNTKLSSYKALIGGDCTSAGSVTLVANTPASCTITNTRLPTLTVTKICVPDPYPGKFDILVDGKDRGDVSCATGGLRTIPTLTLAIGNHTLGEEADDGTNASGLKASYGCTTGTIDPVSGAFTLAAGQAYVCTITNTLTADLQITKTDGTDGVPAGSSTTYTIVVTNAGPADVVGAKIDDDSPIEGFAWTAVGTGGASGFTADSSVDPLLANIHDTVNMPAGSTITYTAKMDTFTLAVGPVVNTATVTAPAGTTDPDLTNNSATDSDLVTHPTDLYITKDDGVESILPGGTATYTIVVTNPSSWAANVKVTDTVPSSLSNVTWTAVESGICAVCFAASGTGSISQSGLIPDGVTLTITLTGTLAADASGSLVNTASVALDPSSLIVFDPISSNNSATDTDTILTADLQITKTDGVTDVVAGDSTTYTIVVTNAGPADVVGAKIDDTPLFSGSWTAVQTGGASGFTADSTGIYPTVIADTVDMPSGSTITYTVTIQTSSAASGTFDNTAKVTAPAGTTDPDLTNNSATDTDRLTFPIDLSITKTDGVDSISPGGTVTYTIVLTDPSPWPATFTLTDTVPDSLTGVTWTAVESPVCFCFPASGSGSISQAGTLFGTLTITLTGTLAADASGNLVNTASVVLSGGPDTYDPDLTNNSATDTDTISAPIGPVHL